MTPAAKSPAPALRLKWERKKDYGIYSHEWAAVLSPRCFIRVHKPAIRKHPSPWAWGIYCGAQDYHGSAHTRRTAQLAAEAAARELAMTKLREAEQLWPGITEEAAKARREEKERA